jgi:hypothetical protein
MKKKTTTNIKRKMKIYSMCLKKFLKTYGEYNNKVMSEKLHNGHW